MARQVLIISSDVIYDLKKKNPKWNRTSVDDLIARTLFTEDNIEEEM